ncbi:F-box protein CPR1-like [Rosa rugosa]|uniref:F-box protein CPR1-like n=1 Tax=Rosa rugosa TaxID=74645 RepID=UPI002B402344|nr:F-box protein CPR1-like [Rosa rugosa]
MAETDLPEDVILNILSWLPVKSLIRFTSVSKRFRSIILYDPKLARTQFEAACQRKTLSCRLIFHTVTRRLESLDLDTPSYGDISSSRKLSFPFEEPGSDISLLGSCNGLVFVAFGEVDFYIWNPATRFFMELPKPGFSDGLWLRYYGAGYLSATDDYKVFAASYDVYGPTREMKMFSLRAHVWKTIQHPGHDKASDEGTLLNEAIHWLVGNEILAFDFAQEEFRTMRLPDHHEIQDPFGVGYVGVSEGCLCVCGHRRSVAVKGVGGEWSLVKIDHKEEEKFLVYTTGGTSFDRYRNMIPYEESLLRINF